MWCRNGLHVLRAPERRSTLEPARMLPGRARANSTDPDHIDMLTQVPKVKSHGTGSYWEMPGGDVSRTSLLYMILPFLYRYVFVVRRLGSEVEVCRNSKKQRLWFLCPQRQRTTAISIAANSTLGTIKMHTSAVRSISLVQVLYWTPAAMHLMPECTGVHILAEGAVGPVVKSEIFDSGAYSLDASFAHPRIYSCWWGTDANQLGCKCHGSPNSCHMFWNRQRQVGLEATCLLQFHRFNLSTKLISD